MQLSFSCKNQQDIFFAKVRERMIEKERKIKKEM